MDIYKLIITSLLLFQTGLAVGQSQFYKTFDPPGFGMANAAHQNPDGTITFCGRLSNNGSGTEDIYVIKTDMNGDTLWTRIFGGNDYDVPGSMQPTTDNGYIICGATQSFGAGYTDNLLLKLDSSGNQQWVKTFGLSKPEGASDILQTADSCFIFTGSTTDTSNWNTDLLVLKTDANGNTIWAKAYGSTNSSEMGFTIKETFDGGYVIAGKSESFGPYGSFIMKIGDSGNLLWSKHIVNIEITGGGNKIECTADSGYLFIGNTNWFGAGGDEIVLCKLDSSGTVSWTKIFGNSSIDLPCSILSINNNRFLISGYFAVPNLCGGVICVDSLGDVIWTKGYNQLGGPNCFISPAVDGGFLMTGNPYGSTNIYFLKADSSGNSCINQTLTVISSNISVNDTTQNILSAPVSFITSNITFSVGSGSIVNDSCSSVGYQELQESINVIAFPNPCASYITLKNTTKNGFVTMYDMLGKKKFEMKCNDVETLIEVEELKSGVYLIRYEEKKKGSRWIKINKL